LVVFVVVDAHRLEHSRQDVHQPNGLLRVLGAHSGPLEDHRDLLEQPLVAAVIADDAIGHIGLEKRDDVRSVTGRRPLDELLAMPPEPAALHAIRLVRPEQLHSWP
jgi:hypothetical protein